MKWLNFNTKDVYTEIGEDGAPFEREVITSMSVRNTEDGRAYAEEHSYDGVITPYDDGEPEPVVEPTAEERIAELEEALSLLLEGATE